MSQPYVIRNHLQSADTSPYISGQRRRKPSRYVQAVLDSEPVGYWRLGPRYSKNYFDLVMNFQPVAYWMMDGNLVPSVGPNLGTSGDPVTWAAGRRPGKLAASFNGNTSLVGNSVVNSLDGNPWTIAAWIRPTTTGRLGIISAGYGLILTLNPNIQVRVDDGIAIRTYHGPNLPNDGKFHYLVGVWKDSILKMYLDGKLVGDWNNVGWNTRYFNQTYIGRDANGASNFVGEISDPQLFDHALSGVDVFRHYNEGAPASPSLIALDLSGNGYHGEYVGVWAPGEGAIFKDETSGSFYRPIGHPDNTGRMDVRDLDLVNVMTGPYAVEGWLKKFAGATTDTNEYHVSVRALGSSHSHTPLRTTAVSASGWHRRANGSLVVATYAVDFYEWHHLVSTWDGATFRFYVDGVLRASGAAPDNWLTANPPDLLRVGFPAHQASSGGYEGTMVGEVAVYDRPLTLSEVLRHYRVALGIGV